MSDLVGNPEDRFSHTEAQFFVAERYNQGIDILKRGLSFIPGAHKLLFLLADSYKKAGNWQESEKTYLEAIRYSPNDLALYFNLGKSS